MAVLNKLVMMHLFVNDVDASKEFYEKKLGFSVTKDKAYGDQRWVSVVLPGGELTINLTNVAENMSAGSNKLFISSPDVEAAYKELTDKGVDALNGIGDDWGKWESPDGKGQKWFEFNDPDGNHWLVIPEAK